MVLVLESPIAPADRYTVLNSPIGPLLLTGNGSQLMGLHFAPDGPGDQPGLAEDRAAFSSAERQLAEYFAGTRETFDLRLAVYGADFSVRVWNALLTIPYGKTAGYGEIAAQLGVPGAARAVGSANHVNPISIVVPCHRVIGADGSMTGYGGGIAIKHHLLSLEAPTLF